MTSGFVKPKCRLCLGYLLLVALCGSQILAVAHSHEHHENDSHGECVICLSADRDDSANASPTTLTSIECKTGLLIVPRERHATYGLPCAYLSRAPPN